MSISNTVHNLWTTGYKAIFSAPTKSSFLDTGRLTPEEYVRAGDQLVSACPSWQWRSGTEKKAELPADKQFLWTEVACEKRVKDAIDTQVIEKDLGDGWALTETEGDKKSTADQPIQVNIDAFLGEETKTDNSTTTGNDQEDEYIEQEIDGIPMKVKVSKQKKPEAPVEEIKVVDAFEKIDLIDRDPMRKYQLSITYDFYYLTPRLWLVGYDSENTLLKEKEMYEDIMDEYANKTVTYETHPHLGVKQLSIHPCKHSDVMKHLIDVAADNKITIEVHQAMFIFLKFISSVVPTMEYDFTIDFEFGGAPSGNKQPETATS
jgi:ubiquitin-like-conjugating enzyme ATG3